MFQLDIADITSLKYQKTKELKATKVFCFIPECMGLFNRSCRL